MKRFEERRQDLINATKRLKEALNTEENELNIDGVLHRYEFTFELCWKTLKDYLNYLGIELKSSSPREVIQQSFSNKIIDNGDLWISMMLARNSLSHIYDEITSREIYKEIKEKYIFEIENVIKKIENFDI